MFAIRNRKVIDASHATDELCSIPLLFSKGRKIVTVHHVVKEGESSDLYRMIWKAVTSAGLHCADSIIAISDETKKDLMDMGIKESKIVRITNEINPIFKKLDIPKKKRIGYVCELIPRKNVKKAIEAFNVFHQLDEKKEFELVICGRGPLKEELEEYVESMGISDYVSFRSRLDDDELVQFYNECMGIFNTSAHEGLGITTIEAQRCGTPVFHIDGTDIPPEVLMTSIGCTDPNDMGIRAFRLFNDELEYDNAVKTSIAYATEFGSGFKEEYLNVLFDGRP
ncbi:MAG: glycosyltransferase [Candidatus Methanomethylophilaceae archaeon]